MRTQSVVSARSAPHPPVKHRVVSVLLVVITAAVVVLAITVGVSKAHGTPAPSTPTAHAAAPTGPTLLQSVSQVDPAVLVAVGSGGLADPFTALTKAPALVDANNLPIVFFVGSESCGPCAAERWSLVVALSRFGTFGHLPLFVTGSGPTNSRFSTFTFIGATYTSEYVALAGFEEADSAGKPLETLTTKGLQLLSTYDAPPYVTASQKEGVPWLDVANQYALQGSSYSPALIVGLDWGHIATRLSSADDPVTRAIVGSANYLTAAICKATSLQPASVCTAAPIAEMIKQLP